MDFCRPFYLFRANVKITDINEDAYRTANNLCKKEDIKQYPDPTLINVWDLVDGDLSTVGIKGENVYRPDLRQSVSIRDRFTVKYTEFLNNLFTKYKVGVGKKNIYVKDDFMAKHRDTRLPDLDGLPHVMTMVVLEQYDRWRGGKLFINDISVTDLFEKNDHNGWEYTSNRIIVFPITSLHEITPIISGNRHSFVFPIYGVLRSFNLLVKTLHPYTNYTTLYSEVLKDLAKMTPPSYGDSEFRGELLGKIDEIGNENLSIAFVKVRNILGDFVPSEKSHGVSDSYSDSGSDHGPIYSNEVVVSYNLDNTQHTKRLLAGGSFDVPENAKNIRVQQLRTLLSDSYTVDDRLSAIHEKVTALQEDYLANLELNRKANLQSESSIATLPTDSFIYVAKNLYYSDTKIENLIGTDAHIYALATKANRKVHVAFIGDLYKYITSSSNIDLYRSISDVLVKITDRDLLPYTDYIQELYAEHDDQGGYDCKYERLHCCLVIGHELDTA